MTVRNVAVEVIHPKEGDDEVYFNDNNNKNIVFKNVLCL